MPESRSSGAVGLVQSGLLIKAGSQGLFLGRNALTTSSPLRLGHFGQLCEKLCSWLIHAQESDPVLFEFFLPAADRIIAVLVPAPIACNSLVSLQPKRHLSRYMPEFAVLRLIVGEVAMK